MAANITQINYEQADTICRTFESESEAIADLHQQMRRYTQSLCENEWKGAAAIAFQDEMEQKALPGLRRACSALSSASQSLRLIVGTYHAAEEEAAALFRQQADAVPETHGSGEDIARLIFNILNGKRKLDEALGLAGAAKLVSLLHAVPLRPNSFAIPGNERLLKIIELGRFQRILTPDTFRNILKGGVIVAGGIDGLYAGADSYFNGKFAGTSAALPAGMFDGALKGAISIGSGFGLIALAGAATAGAAPVAAAAITIGIVAGGGYVVSNFVVDPLLDQFEQTTVHDKLVYGLKDSMDYAGDQITRGAQKVSSAFEQYINNLQAQPSPL